jgi:predicted NUDIX family NTP pyrophosphohydrolase
MELIRELYESELGIGDRGAAAKRHGARFWFNRLAVGVIYDHLYRFAIIVREDGRVGLPSGDFGNGEDPLVTFQREMATAASTGHNEKPAIIFPLSEVQEVGLVIEYLDQMESMVFAYGFAARAGESVEKLEEVNDAQKQPQAERVLWLPPREAIAALSSKEPLSYEEKFIRARDITLMERVLLLR